MASKELTEKQKKLKEEQVIKKINESKKYLKYAVLAFIITVIILLVIYFNLDNISKQNSHILNGFVIIVFAIDIIAAGLSFYAIIHNWDSISKYSRELTAIQAAIQAAIQI